VRRIWRSPTVRAFMDELSPEEREAFHEHELLIYRDPQPDFQTRFRLPGGEMAYFVYYGPLYELVYRLDPPHGEEHTWRHRDPVDLQDTLMILTARLVEDEEAA
jgi:hypothetical protein